MNRILVSLICIFSTFSVFAQTEEVVESVEQKEESQSIREHLTFKGIPIDGTPQEFGDKLKDVGFEYDGKTAGAYYYKGGSFAGYNDCEVIVKAYDNLVYEVVAILPTKYRWTQLYGDYSTLVTSLKKKYGDPTYQKEEFVSTPSYVDLDDDNDKYGEVKDGHCKYYSGFNVNQGWLGRIHIEIKTSGCVGLHYTDSYNEYLKLKAVEDDL